MYFLVLEYEIELEKQLLLESYEYIQGDNGSQMCEVDLNAGELLKVAVLSCLSVLHATENPYISFQANESTI